MTALAHLGGITLLFLDILKAGFRGAVDLREVIRQLDRLIINAMPLMLVAGALAGGVVATQGLTYVTRFNATEVYGWASGFSAFREVGPLLLGLALAARVGSKNAAELASMNAHERLSALTALGIDVQKVVIRPRIFAIFGGSLLVFPLATSMVVISSFLIAYLLGGQSLFISYHSLAEYLSYEVVLEGLLRLALYGLVTGVCSTYFGLSQGRDARSVGRAVFDSSVACLSSVVILNLVITLLEDAS